MSEDDYKERAIYFASKVIFFAESLNSETITKMHDAVWNRNVEAVSEATQFLINLGLRKQKYPVLKIEDKSEKVSNGV